MKKNKLAVLLMTAVLSAGAMVSTAYGAAGWAQDSSQNWVYYDSNGNKVTYEWKKGADDLWRYLDGSGKMLLNSWVDDTYYVDANGIMVTGKWLKLSEYDGDESYWYYFNTNGKVVTDGWKKIDNKWYHFDDEGRMETGWVDDDMYYTTEDGVMKTGWQKLFPSDDEDEDDLSPADEDGDGKYWYYFASSGKKYCAEGSDEYIEKKINGVYYCFNSDGQMATGWVNIGDDPDENASIEDYRYYGDDGKGRTGWLSLEPPEAIAGNYEYEVEWFYFSNQGKPKTGPKEGDASTSDLVKLNGRTYLFNDMGNPVYGLQKLEVGATGEYTAYYFGDKENSSVLKGKRKVEEDDGSTSQFYFLDSGRGVTGPKDGYLYYMGKLQEAESGTKYQVYTIEGKNYVVNTSGKLARSTTVKSGDGIKYKTNGTGILVKEDDEDPSDSYSEPNEPVWTTN